MKVIALTLTTLCLVALTQANWDYKLQCAREEIGIRWPSYFSNSDYYVCTREGGKQLTITCPPGELFTFVLQSCTAPNKFIPPPPLNILPLSSISSSVVVQPAQPPQFAQPTQPELMQEPKPYYPKPIHKPDYEVPLHPPVINENPTNWEGSAPFPPVIIEEPPHPEMPAVPAVESSEQPSLPEKPVENPEVPLPPTPAPTPPVVPVALPPKKKQIPSLPGHKLLSKPPGDDKKMPPKPSGKKVPPKPAGKKQTPPSHE